MSDPFHHIRTPEKLTTSVVFASPHSGRSYDAAFLTRSRLDRHTIRSSEDAFVDQLFSSVPLLGAPLLQALSPRAYVDLNRSPEELDPALIEGVSRRGHNPRVLSGLGVIPRVVANGRPIYDGKLTMVEAQQRLNRVWYPYHDSLRGLLQQAHARFGQAILIDCHSMPREALDTVSRTRSRRPDIVIGDRFGVSADSDIVERIEAAFAAAGFETARNAPFAGAYIAQTYGRPSRGHHAIQIEIDRSLYMDEATLTRSPQFGTVTARLEQVIRDIADIGRPRRTQPLAAE